MGHYRSELVSESEENREQAHKEKRLKNLETGIQAAIDENGVARVIAEMVADRTLFSIGMSAKGERILRGEK
jgi:hypothetical protein